MRKREYRATVQVQDREAMDAIARDDIERLITLPFDLGLHHENWRFIQDVCVRLSEHRDWRIRSSSLQGLAYAAELHRRLEKNVVKPVLLRALKDKEPGVVQRAGEAVAYINQYMKWRIGGAKRQKELEARYEKNRG
jgi:hypothetical protein